MGNRLFVGNISFRYAGYDSLSGIRRHFGEVSDVHLPMDRETGRMRGFAFVTMATGRGCKPRSRRHGKSIEGRPLVVTEGVRLRRDRPPRGPVAAVVSTVRVPAAAVAATAVVAAAVAVAATAVATTNRCCSAT